MNTNYIIHNGDNLTTLKSYPNDYFDSIVTDPPYGIKFLGKDWDSKKATETTSKLVALQGLPSGMAHTSLADDLEFQYWMRDVFKECLRVLKPGGHLLAFSAARTYHHMAMAAQTAGFEIRDQLMWIYASGFPKSQDVGKQIDRAAGKKDPNYGTTKSVPYTSSDGRTEPTTARCGICGTASVGAGGAGIKACTNDPCGLKYSFQTDAAKEWAGWGTQLKPAHEPICMARKPIPKGSSIAKNCQKYGTGAINVDESRIGDFKPTAPSTGTNVIHRELEGSDEKNAEEGIPNSIGRFPSNVIGEVTGYEKFFFQPKCSRKERHIGHEIPEPLYGDTQGCYDKETGERFAAGLDKATGNRGNNHPTVKPVALMDYLIKLVTKPGGIVLDPFNGSGSTGMAAVKAGYKYVGCELDANYCEISKKRIDAWCATPPPKNNADDLFE